MGGCGEGETGWHQFLLPGKSGYAAGPWVGKVKGYGGSEDEGSLESLRAMSEDLGLGWLLGQRSGVWSLSLLKGLPLLLALGLCGQYVSEMVSDTQ